MPAAAEKIDLFKQHKSEYVTPRKPVLVTAGTGRYLSIPGKGEPGSEVFQAAIGGLYAMAYTIKMTSKAAGRDYKVCPLEGLYGGKSKPVGFGDVPKDRLNWRLLIRVPSFVTQAHLDKAVEALAARGKADAARRVSLEKLQEGRCVQVLHVGPYGACGKTVEAMAAFAAEQGFKLGGTHHEIYLSDPRRVPEERLRTIIRHPVR